MNDWFYLTIIFWLFVVGVVNAYKLISARKQRDKAVKLSSHLLARIENFIKYENRLERDKKTMREAIKNTKMPFQEGFNEKDLVRTITDSHQMIAESNFKYELAKEELLEYFYMIEKQTKGKEAKCG